MATKQIDDGYRYAKAIAIELGSWTSPAKTTLGTERRFPPNPKVNIQVDHFSLRLQVQPKGSIAPYLSNINASLLAATK
jgi:hypothetical protein